MVIETHTIFMENKKFYPQNKYLVEGLTKILEENILKILRSVGTLVGQFSLV